jgi:hypothetical protein
MKLLIVDSQLLLLLVVGIGGRADMAGSKRLCSQYSEIDFERLVKFVMQFDRIPTLPNILTEVSNFIGDSDMPRTNRARAALKAIIQNAVEVHQPSESVVQQQEFDWLGITDTAQLLLLESGHSLITNDRRLYAAALNRGLQAIVLSEIRT